jgi:hypothetical protein
MKTAQFNKIHRQKAPWLKDVVLSLRNGDIERALGTLSKQGAVHEVSHQKERFQAIGKWFAEAPESALVVSRGASAIVIDGLHTYTLGCIFIDCSTVTTTQPFDRGSSFSLEVMSGASIFGRFNSFVSFFIGSIGSFV